MIKLRGEQTNSPRVLLRRVLKIIVCKYLTQRTQSPQKILIFLEPSLKNSMEASINFDYQIELQQINNF